MHDVWIECAFRDRFDVMRLKVLATAAPGTLPSVPLKGQNAIGEIDFIILGCNRLDIRYTRDRVVILLHDTGYDSVRADVWILD